MVDQPCTICGSTQKTHVHNNASGEVIPDYFTVGRGETDIESALRWQRRALIAERVCVLFGWTGVSDDPSERAKALHEVWVEWLRSYEAAGLTVLPKDHPDLNDDRIKELADRRDAIRAATMNRIEAAGLLIEVK